MAIMNLNYYKKSNIPMEYWNRIADFLSCCDAEEHGLESESYDYFRYGEDKVVFQYLLEKLEIPKIFWEIICKELICPECNRGISLDSFISINYSYHDKREFDEMVLFIQRETAQKFKKFYNFIRYNPKKCIKHRIGLQLKKEIENIQLSTISDQIWYRARNFINKKVNIYTKEEMLPPPSKKAKEGRYNYEGERVLYLGDSEITCIAEINNGNLKQKCCIQKFKISSKRILDISDYTSVETLSNIPLFIAGLLFSEVILKHNYRNCKNHPEYAITHYIADLCKERKIDGIIYPSSIRKDRFDKRGKNLVLFNWKNNYKFEEDPYVFDGSEHIYEIKMFDPKKGEYVKPNIYFLLN